MKGNIPSRLVLFAALIVISRSIFSAIKNKKYIAPSIDNTIKTSDCLGGNMAFQYISFLPSNDGPKIIPPCTHFSHKHNLRLLSDIKVSYT